MASLMDSIETGNVPETDSRDNIDTLRIVNAVYRSAEEGRSVRPEEIE